MSDLVRDYQRAAQVRPFQGEIPATDDRLAQARDEALDILSGMAAGQVHLPRTPFEAFKGGFVSGAAWADDNPQPRTITLAQSEEILEAGRTGRYEDHEAALRAAGIEVDDSTDVPTHCAACGKPATGFAMINDERFCHPDEGPSCYMGGQR